MSCEKCGLARSLIWRESPTVLAFDATNQNAPKPKYSFLRIALRPTMCSCRTPIGDPSGRAAFAYAPSDLSRRRRCAVSRADRQSAPVAWLHGLHLCVGGGALTVAPIG